MAELETLQMLIDGQWVDASYGARYDSVDPATGDVWATMPEATSEDVDRAVRAAEAAGISPRPPRATRRCSSPPRGCP